MSDKYAALKQAAERATPGTWSTSYIPPYGSHYVVSPGGETVVNLSEGDVPARDAGYIAAANPATILELLAERDADKARIAELTEFLMHVKKCLVKNGEYSPLSHEAIDTLLDIRADGISLKIEGE